MLIKIQNIVKNLGPILDLLSIPKKYSTYLGA